MQQVSRVAWDRKINGIFAVIESEACLLRALIGEQECINLSAGIVSL